MTPLFLLFFSCVVLSHPGCIQISLFPQTDKHLSVHTLSLQIPEWLIAPFPLEPGKLLFSTPEIAIVWIGGGLSPWLKPHEKIGLYILRILCRGACLAELCRLCAELLNDITPHFSHGSYKKPIPASLILWSKSLLPACADWNASSYFCTPIVQASAGNVARPGTLVFRDVLYPIFMYTDSG